MFGLDTLERAKRCQDLIQKRTGLVSWQLRLGYDDDFEFWVVEDWDDDRFLLVLLLSCRFVSHINALLAFYLQICFTMHVDMIEGGQS